MPGSFREKRHIYKKIKKKTKKKNEGMVGVKRPLPDRIKDVSGICIGKNFSSQKKNSHRCEKDGKEKIKPESKNSTTDHEIDLSIEVSSEQKERSDAATMGATRPGRIRDPRLTGSDFFAPL